MPVTADDGSPFFGNDYEFKYGKADLIRKGDDAAIIVLGALCGNAVAAHDLLKEQGINARVVQIASPTSIDVEAVCEAAKTGLIVTVEDHLAVSGLGSIVAETIAEQGLACKIIKLGVTYYGSSGTPAELFANYDLNPEGIAKTVKESK